MGRGPDAEALAYCAGRDVVGRPPADVSLIPYDLWTNRAHALMLARTGLIKSQDGAKLLRALARLSPSTGPGGRTSLVNEMLKEAPMAVTAAFIELFMKICDGKRWQPQPTASEAEQRREESMRSERGTAALERDERREQEKKRKHSEQRGLKSQ